MSSKFLKKEAPLVVDKELAEIIGLNEAIILQQIEYWLNINEKARNTNVYKNSKWYTFQTIEAWQKEFPFWSYDTVKRTLKKLRKLGIIETENYNEKKYDKTLWYSINYDVLDAICENFIVKKQLQMAQTLISAKCTNGLGQNAPMDQGKMHQPIQETKKETKKEIKTSKGKPLLFSKKLIELFEDGICKLGKTTKAKFIDIVENHDHDFISSVILYCKKYSARSFKYFKNVLDESVFNGIKTAIDFENKINNFIEENKNKKNSAIREKEFNKVILERSLTEFKENKAINSISKVKDVIKDNISDISFRTWIEPVDISLVDKNINIVCKDSFSCGIVKKRYELEIIKALSYLDIPYHSLNYKFE